MESIHSNGSSGGRDDLVRMLYIWGLGLLMLTCVGAPAQQAPCSVPVNVAVRNSFPTLSPEFVDGYAQIHPAVFKVFGPLTPDFTTPDTFVSLRDWTLARDLPPAVFTASEGKRPVNILSVRTDRGPRRIVFVAENGAELPEAARKIEVALITDILSKARPADSFALLSARGPRVEARFGQSRDVVRSAAESLAVPPQEKSRGMGVRDAILEAAQWLQPPQPGDSIFLWTLRLEGRHQAGFSKVRDAVEAGRIRVYAFQLGSYLAGDADYYEPEDVSPPHKPSFDQAFVLSGGTGGLAVLADTESKTWYKAGAPVRQEFKLTNDFLEQLKGDAERMYDAATEFYVLGLSSIGPHLDISLAPSAQKLLPEKLPVAMLVYPRNLPPCSNATVSVPANIKNLR